MMWFASISCWLTWKISIMSNLPLLLDQSNPWNWKAWPFILGNECCECLAYYGIATNLVSYHTKKLHQGNDAARGITKIVVRGVRLIGSFLIPINELELKEEACNVIYHDVTKIADEMVVNYIKK
ncbi:hypothetical protein L1987_27916 [Smallanthus sonchifolius]|uniref:Uncharacterized protein n=1 Tax=Smallanthus sonchifolius TaxID=185202 RepID=A0ACB9IDL7_9ASTR|nr:hypothetical protein L1987_27916 [Smallanthus sonchifolius]